MTKKTKSTPKKTTSASTKREDEMFNALLSTMRTAATTSPGERRKELLARVAGSIAAGLVQSPSPSIASPPAMATAALDIAEEILKQAGIAPIEVSAGEGREGYGAAS